MAEQEKQSLPVRVGNLTMAPAVRQLGLLIGIAGSVALGVVVVLWARGPHMSMLYPSMSDRDAVEVVQALETAAIPHELNQATGALMVPADRIHDARLQLAAQGLPQGTGMGYELMADETGFGVSQFMETARYQHMLETELVRTISSLRPVQNARIHLALPKQTVFLRDRKPPGASVMVNLYPGRRLEESQVAAVVHLVASSIPEMAAGDVTVVDQQGRLLTSPEQASDLSLTSQQFQHLRRVEQDFGQRIEDLLAPIVGPGRVRANVTVDMDFTVASEVRERYDPESVTIRSEQTAREDRIGSGDTAAGVPGALSNQPPEAAGVGEADNSPTSNSARRATRNYEVDRTVSEIRQQSGRVQRLSVAVIVDDWRRADSEGIMQNVPLTDEEVSRLNALVRETVGFDEARGDSVNVINQSFRSLGESEMPEAMPLWQQPIVVELTKQAFGALLLLGVLLTLVRPFVRDLLAPTPSQMTPALIGGDTPALEGATLVAVENSGSEELLEKGPSYEEKVAMARELVGQDPKRVAQVVKGWVANDG